MTIVTGHYTLDLTELPAKAPDLRIRFVPQLVNRKNTALVLYPNAEPGFEPSYVRYVAMMEFRHLLLSERVILIVQGRGQLVVTGQRLVGMITDGSMGKVSLNESVGSVYAFAFDLDDIRPVEIKEKNRRGEPIEAIIESKVGQSSVFGIKVFDHGEFLLLKDDGQVKLASLSAFLDQLTPESRRNLQVAQENSGGGPISAHDSTVLPSDSSDWPGRLNNLGAELLYGYELAGNLTDLEAAISYLQQAIQAAPSDSPDWPAYLSNLGVGLAHRYTRTGNLADLDAAISASQQVVEATPSNSPNWPMYLSNLGNELRDRYERTGNLADLETAISHFQQAVQATPSNSPAWPSYLSSLGTGLVDRYTRTGNLADLEAAITYFQQAVDATPSDSFDRPDRLNNLGNGLLDRYTHTGNLADLEAAISHFQQAVQAALSNSPGRPMYLSSLGTGLVDRYTRTGNLADLEAAITYFQQAIDATPSTSPDWPRYLNNLALILSDRYTRSGNLADLNAAISVSLQVVEATPSDSPSRPGRLSNLGNILSDRYTRSGNLADLNAAISVSLQVVEATPSNSPNWPDRLSNLAAGLRDRYEHTGDLADLDAAIAAWEKSWSNSRFAALPVAYQLGQQLQGAIVADNLITSYLEQAVQRLSHTPSAYNRALEVVEGSKSRLLTQLVGRGPLPLPSGLSSEVAVREQQLLAVLTSLDTHELTMQEDLVPMQWEASRLQRLQHRQATLRELEDLWTWIVQIGPEGTEYVALRRSAALTWQEFARLSEALRPTTALLSFFTTTHQALLFLLRAGWHSPYVVEVPLNQTDWSDLLDRFFREIHSYRPGVRRSETWDQPLLPLLTKAQHHLEGVERLILAPAGNGHLLPWGVLAERAGWHTAAGQPLPLVMLPALGILPLLRQRPHVPPGPALVIGNPHGDLPSAGVEANAVAERFGTRPLLGAAATKYAVLTRLTEATLIHLATHAFFDANNPLESGIVLTDGVLTAREVLQHRLQADLLVLSACESGRLGSLGGEELAGLSQAFLQAGVRSMLVSLWRVNDPATAALMQAFYSARQAGADKAVALRQAMKQIQQHPRWTHPYYWGAFVLVGDWD